ncbi:hypothetical protein [Curtobacterium sp. MCJR17_043]|uniref:hypothetical protein n=1 Tax=Curtobacterium sp. MCJR17_043 TaxID=2175660 RepID=UPI0024DF9598|nr:hypothetical protein [Curtobacterium sp. MCJR17_043]WIB36541.1 hypothetical protein DEJ15_05295 [Curtobacterium sp. MCJR17_043]
MLGLPFSYGRHEVASGGLAAFVAGLGPEWRGLSLTMPLKREVVPLLDRTTPLVDELGVANTVAFRHEGSSVVLAGANTDVEGDRPPGRRTRSRARRGRDPGWWSDRGERPHGVPAARSLTGAGVPARHRQGG